MIGDFNLYTTELTTYVVVNWILTLITTFLIVNIFKKRRFLFLKPSIVLLTYSHIFFQWPATIFAGYYEKFLPYPYDITILIHSYILIGLIVSANTLDKPAQIVWKRIIDRMPIYDISKKSIYLLLGIIVFIVAVYLSYISFSRTGFHAIFTNPASSAIAREKSLKLIDNQMLKYTYAFMTSTVAPLLSVMLLYLFIKSFKHKKVFTLIITVITMIFIMFAVSLTGTRVSLVNLLLVLTIALIIKNGIKVSPVKLIIAAGIILLPAVVISILREGKTLEFSLIPEYFGYVLRRVFIDHLNDASLYVHYAQTNGLFGIAAIPKLAFFTEVSEPINAPNIIGLYYGEKNILASVSNTAGYLFTYYSYFGIYSIIFSILGLFLLDVGIYVYMILNDHLLIPCIAATTLAILLFIQTDYTTAWLTHGFGMTLILSVILNKIVTMKKSEL